ncbi:hypothetical protein [Robertmurraya korlensis]|uniref:hypothetical protein n=1 Tax=Robertmurraya korlensis TaxID=519977 RepID=UPI0008263175|nr:hypothetical protein [Robertmurraya korlensis]
MKIPIMEPASGVYLEAVKKYKRFGQITLMSAFYLLNGRKYKLVGTYNNGPFGLSFTSDLSKFIVVEENGTVVTDYELSKKALAIYHTMYTLWKAEQHIRSGVDESFRFVGDLVEDPNKFVEILAPVMQGRRREKEVYIGSFKKFFEYLEISDQTGQIFKNLSMSLINPLESALNRRNVSEETYIRAKSLLLDFVRCSDNRTSALLGISDCLFSIQVILEDAKKDSNINSPSISKTIDKVMETVSLFEGAIKDTVMNQVKNHNRSNIDEIIEITHKRMNTEDFIIDDTNESMLTKWPLRG